MADGKVVIDVILEDGKVVKGVADIEGTFGKMKNTVQKGTGNIKKMAGALGLIYAAKKGIDMVTSSLDGAIDRYDTLNSFPRVMEMIGFSAEESSKAMDRLSEGIDGLPTTLDSVAKTAQNIAVMTGDLEGATETTLALNNAFLASGASTADAERGLEQYVQMLSKGEVDLQSWRTLQETMGVALNTLAEQFGFTGASAQNDLYDALKSGKITFDEFNAQLIEASNAQGGFAELASTASGGIKTSWSNIKTAVVKGVADVVGAIDKAMGGVGSIESMLDNVKGGVKTFFAFVVDGIPVVVEWFNKFKSTIQDWYESSKGFIDNMIQSFRPLVDNIIDSFVNLYSYVEPIWESLKTLFESIMPILEMLGALIGGGLALHFGTFISIINGVIAALGPFINALINLADVIVNVVNLSVALLTGDFSGAWEYVKNIASSTVEFFINIFDTIVTYISTFVTTIIDFFQGLYMTLVGNSIIPDMVNEILQWFRNLVSKAVQFVTDLVTNVINFFKNLGSNAVSIISSAVTSVIGFFSDLGSQVTSKVSDLVSVVKEKFEETKNIMKEKATDAVKEVITTIGELPGKIKEKATEFFEAGKNIVTSIADGIKSSAKKVTGAIGGVASKIRGFLPFSPAKEGPLKDIMDVKWGETIGSGIEKAKGKVGKSTSKLAQSISDELNPEVSVLAGITGINASNYIGNLNKGYSIPKHGNTPNNSTSTNFDMQGIFNGATFNVRSDNDIKQIAKELNDYIKTSARSKGVVIP